MFPFSEYTASWNAQALKLTDILNRPDDTNPFMFGFLRNIFWLMGEISSIPRQIYPRNRVSIRGSGQRDPHFLDFDRNQVALSPHLLSKASGLERRIQKYFDRLPRLYTGAFAVSSSQLHECRVTTECYRRATLLYLYQGAPGLTTPDVEDELCISTLDLLMSIPADSPTLAFHSFILVVAGSQVKKACVHNECVTSNSTSSEYVCTYRDLVLDRLILLEMRFPAQLTFKHARTLLQEVRYQHFSIRIPICGVSPVPLHSWFTKRLTL